VKSLLISRTKFSTWKSALGLVLLGLVAAGVRAPAQGDFQGASHLMPFDEDTIAYSKARETGRVARLQQRLDSGEVQLTSDDAYGYLLSLLRGLDISTNSQMLVFSKTSFQRDRIGPKAPRALFFNDDVYVGYVPGSPLLEISAADPRLGGVFYTLGQARAERPRFMRTDQCLECHASAKTMGVPGPLVRSFATDESGVVDLASGTSLVNHRTPIEERWGGWYVTGQHGRQTHRGNLIGPAAFDRQQKEPNHAGNQTNLSRFFDGSAYPAPTSDIAALLVLEHQVHMHNFITRLNYEATLALKQYGHLNYLRNVTESFLRYLLFVEEAPLASPVHGSEAFAREFTARGPRDRQGRSLREFDLRTRLFKYPCSYLIYSEAFDALPGPMKERLYQRLHDILTGKDDAPEFQQLSQGTRRAILEILAATKSGLPQYWKAAVGAAENGG
jgi:hypothetical protein